MVNEAMLPRTAVREVEQRLTAAGCPDADFDARELFRLATGRDVRLSDRPLTAEQAAALEALCTRRAARERPYKYEKTPCKRRRFLLLYQSAGLCSPARTKETFRRSCIDGSKKERSQARSAHRQE